MTDTVFDDRARGVLIGLGVGDALGAPLVGMGREQARIRHGEVTTFLGGGLYQLAPGATTARVGMARAAALALLDEPAGATEHLLAAYSRVLAEGRPGLGEATRASLERIRDGEDPSGAAAAAHDALGGRSAGIGPAIRAVPFAIRWHGDPATLHREVMRDAALTHADPRAGAAAVALVALIGVHLDGEEDPARAVEAVRERMADRPELPDVLPPPAAVRGIAPRPTAFAPDVLHAALYHLMRAKSARRAVVGAVNEAGAAAALGAVTGAVAGARFGAEAFPKAWTALLEGAPSWRKLADRLATASR